VVAVSFPAQQPPGRGTLVRRGRRPLVVQVAWSSPEDDPGLVELRLAR